MSKSFHCIIHVCPVHGSKGEYYHRLIACFHYFTVIYIFRVDPDKNRSLIPLACRTRLPNKAVYRMRLEKSRPCVTVGVTR